MMFARLVLCLKLVFLNLMFNFLIFNFMKLSFIKKRSVAPIVASVLDSEKLPVPDQFPASEFFFENGKLLSDVNVVSKLSDSPELQSKLREYMVEQDVSNFDDTKSDEEVFNALSSQYKSKYEILRDLEAKESELNSK